MTGQPVGVGPGGGRFGGLGTFGRTSGGYNNGPGAQEAGYANGAGPGPQGGWNATAQPANTYQPPAGAPPPPGAPQPGGFMAVSV